MATRDHHVDAALKLGRLVVTLPTTWLSPFVPSLSHCRRCVRPGNSVLPLRDSRRRRWYQVPQEEIPPPAATPVPPEAAPLEDKKLDQYADAYLDIEQIEVNASAQIENAENRAAAVAIKEKAEGEIIEAIERNGLKLDEFNQITEVAALDDEVRRRITDRVEKRRRI